MEATGVYWKPLWHALESSGIEVLLVNAQHVKAVPGRKTDVKDACWLAQLVECGLLSGSFVPSEVIRDLRDLTRYRRKLVQERTREVQRIERQLEDAGIKIASVASQTLGVSTRRMLDALVAGEDDPDVLADMALKKLRKKLPELREALIGDFRPHHRAMIEMLLERVDHLDATIDRLDERIEDVICPFAGVRDLLCTIPGVNQLAATIIIAEIGVDMTQFPTAKHLASWAKVCPANNESAGKHYSGHQHGAHPYLVPVLVQSAWSAARTKDTYLAATFWRLAGRIGREKAAIAVAHSILIAVWHMIAQHEPYQDLGPDYFQRRQDPERRKNKLVGQLEALGLKVTVEPAQPAA